MKDAGGAGNLPPTLRRSYDRPPHATSRSLLTSRCDAGFGSLSAGPLMPQRRMAIKKKRDCRSDAGASSSRANLVVETTPWWRKRSSSPATYSS